MGFVAFQGYTLGNALVHLVTKALQGDTTVPMAGTKREQAQKENRTNGILEGVSYAIAEMLTLERVRSFPLVERFDKVDGFEVRRILVANKDRWEVSPGRGDTASEIVDEILALVPGVTNEYATINEELRRKAIRQGLIAATDGDREWIEAEAAKKQAELDNIMNLLKPAGDL